MSFVTVQAALAVGSVLWGLVASWQGTRMALLAAASTFLVLLALHRRVRVRLGGDKDILPRANCRSSTSPSSRSPTMARC